MRISEALLNESIVGDLRNSIVRGLKPEYGPGTEAYENILKGKNGLEYHGFQCMEIFKT